MVQYSFKFPRQKEQNNSSDTAVMQFKASQKLLNPKESVSPLNNSLRGSSMDGAFYRGSATEQSTKFSDKEKKLLREMKFEKQLETDVNLKKIDINVIKPWVTQKLTNLLGMEDDVVNEYVFSQLEEKNLNPKIMQINLTGFLNARRAREFMGELWQLLIEAQETPDGIPMSLVQKKIEELKATDKPDDAVNIDLKDTSSNWNNRYQSLTYGKYKPQVKEEDDDEEEPSRQRSSTSPKPSSSNNVSRDRERRRRDRSESPERRRRRRSGTPERHRRKRSRTPERHRRKRSHTPEKRKKKRDRSPERRERKRSRSPDRRRRRDKSRSPRREKKRSRSPRRERKRSPSSERRERSQSDDS